MKHIAVVDGHHGIVAWEADALEAGIGTCGQRHAGGIHEGTVEVGVAGRMVEMRVGVDDIAHGLRGQRLAVTAQVAGAIARVDADGCCIALDEIDVVAVGEDAPRARCDELGLEPCFIHGTVSAVGTVDEGVVARREVDGVDGMVPSRRFGTADDDGAVGITVATLRVENLAGRSGLGVACRKAQGNGFIKSVEFDSSRHVA